MTSQPPQIDLYKQDTTFRANPHSAYARLRATSPIHRVTLPDGRGAWLVTRYEDAASILRDKRFVKDWRNALSPEQVTRARSIPEAVKLVKNNMLYKDPPDHARLRRLLSGAFTLRLIERMRPRIQEIADALLDAVKDKGEMNLFDDYAFPLPMIVISELLGVPAEDRDNFRKWTEAAVSGNGTRKYLEKIAPGMQTFADYLSAIFDAKRKDPEDDLISALVRAQEAGDKLSDNELLGMVFLLLIAGHATTTGLIVNGMLALLQHPDQLERLRKDPSRVEEAIEELLRYEGPLDKATERFAKEDVAIGGTIIPKGELVLVVIAAANRDPERFPGPDTLDITRTDNKHLAFGRGAHHCPGAPLARIEGQIAISTLLRRLPGLRLKVSPESLPRRPGLLSHVLMSLPVEF